MSMNQIQFQHGLSLHEFMRDFGSEQQCEEALAKARWPHGWRCSHCGCARFFHTRNGQGRLLWECFINSRKTPGSAGEAVEV